MAQKFGGKYSPSGNAGTAAPRPVNDGQKVDAAGAKSNVLFIPPVVLLFRSWSDGATTLMMAIIAAAFMLGGAYMLREGLRAEAAYNSRAIAKRPTLPRKILAAILVPIGVMIAGMSHGGGVLESALYGVIVGILLVTAFGIDPLSHKRVEGIDDFQQDRVARVVDEAENYLSSMTDHITRVNDRALKSRVAQFQSTVRTMIRTVEEDPRDLTGARKYLGVYLMGARDATVKFADLYSRSPDEMARADYEALLSDLENNFTAHTQKMLGDDRTDMDIEIKVLRDRLQREGIK